MRTVFFGTSDFAAAVLRRLAVSEHPPVLVLSRPDARRGRGRRIAAPPVAEAARGLGLEVVQPASVNTDEARATVAAAAPDVGCVCAYGALIREPLLSDLELLNVHPSLLPRWRGAAPLERAIMAGDRETGVSIMRLVAELDAGPVCLQGAEAIEPGDTYGTLAPRLEALGGELLVRALDERPAFVPQPHDGVAYAEKIEGADRTLDPARPAVELERVVRALSPHVGARIVLADATTLGVGAAAVAPSGPPPGALGERDGALLLGTADGALELRQVQPPGGRAMAGGDFLRGHPLP